MSKFIILPLCFLLISSALSAVADEYNDCRDACKAMDLAPCLEQAHNTAGNIQEEQASIATCNKTKADCVQSCKDKEATPDSPPPSQPQTPSEEKPAVDLNGGVKAYDSNDIKTYDGNGIKTYDGNEIKSYEFK